MGSNRRNIVIIAVSVFVATVAIGLIIMKSSDSNTGGGSAVSASTTTLIAATSPTTRVPEPTTTTTAASPPSVAEPTTPAPVQAVPVVVNCGSYAANDALPLLPCDQGYGVNLLQQALVAEGYSIVVDGQYGQGTTNAVQAYQVSTGLQPSGITDLATWKSILCCYPGTDLNGDGVVGPNEVSGD